MGKFARSFATEALVRWDTGKQRNLVRQLFEKWALPGHDTTDEKPLRLGLRDGYVNFYVKGQSVAKLSCNGSGPRLKVHNAYVEGRVRSKNHVGTPTSQRYVIFDAALLAEPAADELVEGWINTAETYASAEKRFVDDLVATNPGVVDLEMGLPASDVPGIGKRVAPRMDIVVVQPAHDGRPSIAFWEAKCAINGELRARAEYKVFEEGNFEGPKVLNQLGKYVGWMAEGDRVAEVQKAYIYTAQCMLELHSHFFRERNEQTECLAIWRALAESDGAIVITQPGIVVGNYWPRGSTEEITRRRMEQAIRSFVSNGHRANLELNGAVVHEVGADTQERKLPHLVSTGTST